MSKAEARLAPELSRCTLQPKILNFGDCKILWNSRYFQQALLPVSNHIVILTDIQPFK